MDWHKAGIAELGILQKCAVNNSFFANNYSAVNSVLYAEKYSSSICVLDDWIYEKFSDGGKTVFSFPHNVNGTKDDIKSALDVLIKEASGKNVRCMFENITADEKEMLLSLYDVETLEPVPPLCDYIYLTENLSMLSGSKYSKKRNHINQFRKKYLDFKFEVLNEDNLQYAGIIEEKWFCENSLPEETADLKKEKEIIFNAIENFGYFSDHAEMSGGILFAGGEPCAFCISSTLSGLVTDVHFEKCLSPYAKDGGYAVINNEFAKTVRTKYINREEDLGIEGLRKAKRSYFPEIILEKYNACL